MVRKILQVDMCVGSKVVEHSTHNPEIVCSNPNASTGREKLVRKIIQVGIEMVAKW
jgi:hypothetical protein